MRTLKSVKRFFANEKGATAIEYGLIAGGIAIVIIVAIGLAGDALVAMFNTIATALTPTPTV
jgi:pilus assembly protein Flp/PilA